MGTACGLVPLLLTASLLLAGTAGSAHALSFDLSFIPGTSAQEQASFTAAAALWSAQFSDNVTVKLTVGTSNLGSSILAQAGISIDAVLQREADEVGGEGSTQTDLIILTHDCVEATMNAAIAQMQALPTVLEPITRIRKEELA